VKLPLSEHAFSPAWRVLLEQNSSVLNRVAVARGGFSVVYSRAGSEPSRPGLFDEICLTFNPQGGEPGEAERLQIAALLNKEFKAFDPDHPVGPGVSEEARHFASLHQSTLERLELLAEDVVRRTTETQARLDEQYADRKRRADEELERKTKELEAAQEQKRTLLADREAQLEAKLKEIDDRGNTHARREIRNKMLDDVNSRIQDFGVSKNTAKKREPVAKGILLLIFVFFSAMTMTLVEIDAFYKAFYGRTLIGTEFPIKAENATATQSTVASSNAKSATTTGNSGLVKKSNAANPANDALDKNMLYLLWGRFSLFLLGAVGTILYYIRWQNRWAEQHATSEFQLQQFYIDINRANWVIESGLEWRKETSTEVPDLILASITKNLFNLPNEPEPALHPADELASALLGTASKLKLKAGESELEFDKPSKIPK
jgi:hypothetical protein